MAAGETCSACIDRAWSAYRNALYGYLLRRTGDRDAADDLLQDVFIRAFRQGEDFGAIRDPRAWLFRVARNALVDHHRRQRPTEPVSETLPQSEAEPAPLATLGGCVERTLPMLSETERTILRRVDLDGMRQVDFAAATGLSVAAVKSRLLRARRKLGRVLVRRCRVRFDADGRVCCHLPAEHC
jgi:RNA polymerase sigma-70 factor (ECF subfamily)